MICKFMEEEESDCCQISKIYICIYNRHALKRRSNVNIHSHLTFHRLMTNMQYCGLDQWGLMVRHHYHKGIGVTNIHVLCSRPVIRRLCVEPPRIKRMPRPKENS